MPRIAVGTDYVRRIANSGQGVALEFHGDLEFWRWFVSYGLDTQGGTLAARMCHLLHHPPSVLCFRTRRKPRSEVSVSNLGSTDSTTLAPRIRDLGAEDTTLVSRKSLASAALVGLFPA